MKRRVKILYIEDDKNLSFIVKDSLLDKEYEVNHVADGKDALKVINSSEHFDLNIIDVMLPNIDGFSLAKKIKEKDKMAPIIFLTAKGTERDKIEGFQIGADDYITKPFSIKELSFRIEALLKRTLPDKSNNNGVYNFGNSSLNANELILTVVGNNRELTKKETGILEILLKNINQTVERNLILKEVWGNDSYFNGRSMDVYISKIRKYLQDDDACEINTVHGVGFKLSVK
jgi:two-component system, OmpR family, response regulator VicR